MNQGSASGFQFMKNLMIDCYSRIEANYQQNPLDGMSTGFDKLDKMIGGLNWGEMAVIGGYAGMGKTALALDIARHVAIHAEKKSRVAILSMDKSEADISMRMLATEARIEQSRIISGLLSAQCWKRLADAAGRLAGADIFIGRFLSASFEVLRKKLLNLQEACGPFDLVIVDHLQALSDWHEGMNNKRKLYELMEGLHNMAEEMDVALIAISELSGTADDCSDKRPRLMDFPEYGPIDLLKFDNSEADVVPSEGFPLKEFANKVLLLYRDDMDDTVYKHKAKIELLLAQNTYGESGAIPLWLHAEFASFERSQ